MRGVSQVLIYHWNALAPRAVAELAAATKRLAAAGGLRLVVATEDGRHAEAAAAAAAAAGRAAAAAAVRGHAATPDLQETLLTAGTTLAFRVGPGSAPGPAGRGGGPGSLPGRSVVLGACAVAKRVP